MAQVEHSGGDFDSDDTEDSALAADSRRTVDEMEEDEEEFENIEEKFEKIIRDLSPPISQDLMVVIRDQAHLLNGKTEDGDTLLHMIAKESRSNSSEKLQGLLVHLIERHPKLLEKDNADEQRPLQLCIKKRKTRLVELMCDMANSSNDLDLDDILFSSDSKDNNCLHEAMKAKTSTERDIASNLIRRVRDKTKLCVQNSDGHTPPHLAVKYERCTPSQMPVVRKLLDACDETLDQNIHNLSVYRYHEQTRREYMTRQNSKNHLDQKKGRDRYRTPKQNSTKNLASNPVPKPPKQAPTALANTTLTRRPTLIGHAAQSEGQASKVADKNSGEAISGVQPNPMPADANTTKKRGGNVKEESVTEDSANSIRDLLKLRFMMGRHRDYEATVSFLYGAVQGIEKQLSFLLTGGPITLGEQTLYESKHLRFEDTLRWIELPQFEINQPPPSKLASKSNKSDGQGRKDYAVIFEWLHNNGVERVINLRVDDRKEPSHSEETIETALEKIQVMKLWDWKKYNLSSETILKAAKDVEEVCLFWNGNDAVLRGWSEPDGLNKLMKLKTVNIIESQGLESRARTQRNLSDFSTRLKRNRANLREQTKESRQTVLPPEIEVDISHERHPQKAQGSGNRHESTPAQIWREHTWITCMKGFADFIQNVRLDDSGSQDVEPVTVALIDDGYDISDPEINSKIVRGCSFCRSDSDNAPYFVTSGGHGTLMANKICSVCPKAQLIMLRIDEYHNENGGRQITAESAVQAVRAAIGMGADIISMSWTIEQTNQNKKHIDQLTTALDDAAKKNILLFCSAPDKGADATATYPAKSGRCVIIGAAKASGEADQWLGGAPVDFLFPGHHVVSERPGTDKSTPASGSSIATAFAAGLAALTLYCVQFAVQYAKLTNAQGQYIKGEQLDNLRTRDGMKASFNAIGTAAATKYKYLMVWDVFGEAAKKDHGCPTKEKREAIVKVAERLTQTTKLAL